MNFNKFTIKSQEAIQKAVEITRGSGGQAIEPVHILKGVLTEGDSLVKFIFQKVGVNLNQLAVVIDKEISSLPKVSGGEPYFSRESNDVLQKSLDIAHILGQIFPSPNVESVSVIRLYNVSEENGNGKHDRYDSSPLEEYLIKTSAAILTVVGFLLSGNRAGKALLIGALQKHGAYYKNSTQNQYYNKYVFH